MLVNNKICIFCLVKKLEFYIINRQLCSQSNKIIPIKMAYILYTNKAIKNDVPVIIMHGLFGSKANWSSLGMSIQKHTERNVYAVDIRNHGDSPHTDEHTYLHIAEDLKLFMSDIKAKNAALIGHSMGGRAAMVYALQYPGYIESLTLVDISPIEVPMNDPIKRNQVVIDALKAVKFNKNTTMSEARKSAEAHLIKSLNSKDLAKFLVMNISKDSAGNINWKINLDAINKSFEKSMTKFLIKNKVFTGPTLFVIGGASDYVRLADADKIMSLFPNASFEIIADTGHLVHVERPKVFTSVVSKFIKENSKT